MDDFLMDLFTDLGAEVVSGLIVIGVMTVWHTLRSELPSHLPSGVATRAEFPFWLFTVIALLGVTLLCGRFFFTNPESGWRLALAWVLYLLLSSGVLYVGYELLMARKRTQVIQRVDSVSPGRRLLSQGILAKAAIILLWTGVLLFTGPRPSLLVWSLGLGLIIDGYVFWEVLKLD